jgi:hypothetical protein
MEAMIESVMMMNNPTINAMDDKRVHVAEQQRQLCENVHGNNSPLTNKGYFDAHAITSQDRCYEHVRDKEKAF